MALFDNFFKKDNTTESYSDQGPWAPTQPHWESLMNRSSDLSTNKNAFKTYRGSVLAPMNPTLKGAYDRISSTSYEPIQGLDGAFDFADGMISNNGMTDDLNRTAGYLTPFANGSMQEDPRLSAAMAAREERAANRAASLASGSGRYGSGAMGAEVGRSIGEASNELMLQSNESARNRQLQASGMLGDLYAGGLNRAGSAASLLPTLNALRFDPAERAAKVGEAMQDRSQADKDARINQFNQKAGLDREMLEWFSAIMNGAGKLGGSTVTTNVAAKKSPFEQLMGGVGLLGKLL
jgi:hypothetical protein